MAKYIGTGKDPRAPEGVDFDVPDADEVQRSAVEEGGLGVPVDPATEMERIHPGERIIQAEGGVPEVAGDAHLQKEGEGDLAARVESTSAYASGSGSSSASEGQALSGLSRDELDDRARAAGVDSPEDLPNKGAVEDAIRAAEGDSGE